MVGLLPFLVANAKETGTAENYTTIAVRLVFDLVRRSTCCSAFNVKALIWPASLLLADLIDLLTSEL